MEWLAEPFEVQDPGDPLTHYPEVMPKEDPTQDVNGILASGDKEPSWTENYCENRSERKFNTSDAFEFTEDNYHET